MRFVGTVTATIVPSISRPPIVAVPAFFWCESGPSALIALRSPSRSSSATSGPPASTETSDAAAPITSALTISLL